MNPTEYAEKAVTVDPLDFSREVTIDDDATVTIRSGYPEPRYGVTLFSGRRGHVNGGIDWGVEHLRNRIAELIVNVAEDCISVSSRVDGIEDDLQNKIAVAIRHNFEIVLH